MIETEAVEMCAWCMQKNTYPHWKTKYGYIARCHHCGREIMLCDECLHADDSTGACDWHEIKSINLDIGECFRGTTINAKTED